MATGGLSTVDASDCPGNGPRGGQGPPGPSGPPGISGDTEVPVNTVGFAAPGSGVVRTADCPPGLMVLGGGGSITNSSFQITQSRPVNATRWQVSAVNRATTTQSTGMNVTAICAVVAP